MNALDIAVQTKYNTLRYCVGVMEQDTGVCAELNVNGAQECVTPEFSSIAEALDALLQWVQSTT